jgi:hypothetical protein
VKFFVSGKIGEESNVKQAIEILRESGHDVTFDWTSIPHLRPYEENADAARDAAIQESQAVKNSNVLLLIPHEKGVGMYVELGIAIGVGIPIRIITTSESNTMFFHHPLVKKVSSLIDVIEEFSCNHTEAS